jgi:hypothetical protein
MGDRNQHGRFVGPPADDHRWGVVSVSINSTVMVSATVIWLDANGVWRRSTVSSAIAP